jgi:hypothetical protein
MNEEIETTLDEKEPYLHPKKEEEQKEPESKPAFIDKLPSWFKELNGEKLPEKKVGYDFIKNTDSPELKVPLKTAGIYMPESEYWWQNQVATNSNKKKIELSGEERKRLEEAEKDWKDSEKKEGYWSEIKQKLEKAEKDWEESDKKTYSSTEWTDIYRRYTEKEWNEKHPNIFDQPKGVGKTSTPSETGTQWNDDRWWEYPGWDSGKSKTTEPKTNFTTKTFTLSKSDIDEKDKQIGKLWEKISELEKRNTAFVKNHDGEKKRFQFIINNLENDNKKLKAKINLIENDPDEYKRRKELDPYDEENWER